MTGREQSDINDMLDEAHREVDAERHRLHEAQKNRSPLRRFAAWYASHKRRNIFLTVLLFIVLVAVVPFTRYAVAGLFITRDVVIEVRDKQTDTPVSGAEVLMQGGMAKTDGDGRVLFRKLRPGKTTVEVSKSHYEITRSNVTIGLPNRTDTQHIHATATGRAVPLRITNTITGEGIPSAMIIVGDAEAQTNDEGEATIVLDAQAANAAAELQADGYNTTRANLTLSSEVTANTFTLTPTGKIYFLSRQSGNIDVVKTDLDGQNREVVLKGTGNEETDNTMLIPSRDWKFLALLARREGSHTTLHLIDTYEDTRTDIDSSAADFMSVGWIGHQFVYQTKSHLRDDWQSGQHELKQFDADSGMLNVLDRSTASGSSHYDYAAHVPSLPYALGDELVYTKNWIGSPGATDNKQAEVIAIKQDSTEKHVVKKVPDGYLSLVQAAPDRLYVQSQTGAQTTYEIYENGVLRQEASLNATRFQQSYPVYVRSPNGQEYVWHEPSSDKYTLFAGRLPLQDKTRVLDAAEYMAYGWYGEEYVLLQRGSELFVAPHRANLTHNVLKKVTDHHKTLTILDYAGGAR